MPQSIGNIEVQFHNIGIDPNRLLTGNRRELTHGLLRVADLVAKSRRQNGGRARWTSIRLHPIRK